MKSLLITTALALVIALPAAAQQNQNSLSRSGMQRTVAPDAVSARLISADQLIDKNVVSAEGRDVGSVDYIVVEPTTGAITTLLIRASGLPQQQGQSPLVAMPWHAIDINLGDTGEVVAKVPIRMIRQVPTFTDQEIEQVTSPRIMAQVVEYYGSPEQAGQGQSNRQGQMGQMQERMGQMGGRGMSQEQMSRMREEHMAQMQDRMGQMDPEQMRRMQERMGQMDPEQMRRMQERMGQMDPEQMRRMHERMGGQDRQAMGGMSDRQQQSRRQGQQQSDSSPQMLLGRGIVGMLAPPAVTTADQMRGLSVTTDDGQQVGEVEMVMINADKGAVDYVLVKQSGQRAGFVPIAFGDLELAPDAQSFTLQPDAVMVGVIAVPDGQRTRQDRMARSADQRQVQAGGQTRGYGSEVYGGSRSQAGQGDDTADTDRTGTRRYDTERTQRQDRSAQANRAGDGGQAGQIERTVLGTIEEIDRRNRMVVLDNGSEFRLAQGVQLRDLSTGDDVRVNYAVRNNDYIATSIRAAQGGGNGSAESADTASNGSANRGGSRIIRD